MTRTIDLYYLKMTGNTVILARHSSLKEGKGQTKWVFKVHVPGTIKLSHFMRSSLLEYCFYLLKMWIISIMSPQTPSVKNQIGNILGFVGQDQNQGYDVGTSIIQNNTYLYNFY